MTLQIGSTIGDYQVIGILGAGGMGQVYKVRNIISDRVEAMKILLPDLANHPELADRFLREIKVQAALDHPNIAQLRTAVRSENQLLMVMEFVDGETLDAKLAAGPLSPGQALGYITQALSALEYAHERGVVHRDVKPANMIVTAGGVLKLMDFGIAKMAGDHRLTMTGTTLGSLYYMSPEQIQGSASIDGRSDLYSLGVALYELVTGKRPFDGSSQFAIMQAHLASSPLPPIQIDPKLPQSLNDVILTSVRREVGERFQTAAAFRKAAEAVSAELKRSAAPPVAPPVPRKPEALPPVSAMAPPPSRMRGVWLVAGALAVIAAVAGILLFATRKATSPTPAAASAPITAPPSVPAASQPVSEAPPQQPQATAPAVEAVPSPSAPDKARVAPPMTAGKTRPAGRDPLPAPSASAPPSTAAAAPAQTPPPASPQISSQAPAGGQVQPPAAAIVPRGPSPAELQDAREQLAMLQVRAAGIRTSLQSLQRSQAAAGASLRGDMQEAATLMNTYLESAANATQAGDIAQAKSLGSKAERQIEKLEKFLNR